MTFTLGCQSQNTILSDAVKYKEHKGAVNSLTCSSLEGHSQELEENINTGIIYLKSTVATSLLCLSRTFPLDRCTYVGEDNGAKTLQVLYMHERLTTSLIHYAQYF